MKVQVYTEADVHDSGVEVERGAVVAWRGVWHILSIQTRLFQPKILIILATTCKMLGRHVLRTAA